MCCVESNDSVSALVRNDSPVPARSVMGESIAAAAGSLSPASRNASKVASVSAPPAESPTMPRACGSTPSA